MKKRYAFTLVCLSLSRQGLGAKAPAPPEWGLKELSQELDLIRKQWSSLGSLGLSQDLKRSDTAGERSLRVAESFFSQMAFEAAKEWALIFLKEAAFPPLSSYLKARLIEARSAQALGQTEKAFHSYLLYFRSALANKDQPPREDLLTAFQEFLVLSRDQNFRAKQVLFPQVISALLLESHDPALARNFKLSAALFALSEKRPQIAMTWLEELQQDASNEEIVLRAELGLAQGEMIRRRWDQAEAWLKKILANPKAKPWHLEDPSYLALGRIASYKGHPETALSFYEKVAEGSPEAEDAHAESVYAHIALRAFSEALFQVEAYALKFPLGRDLSNLQELKPILALKAKRPDQAEKELKAEENKIQASFRAIALSLRPMTELGPATVQKILSESKGLFDPELSLSQAAKHFNQLTRIKNLLGSLRQNQRQVIYVLGKSPIEAIQPQWVHKIHRQKDFVDRFLSLGEKLVQMESKLWGPSLSRTAREELQNLSFERQELLSKPSLYKSQLGNNVTLRLNIFEWEHKLAQQLKRLNEAQASLRGLQYANRELPNSRLDLLLNRMQKSESLLLRALELLRARLSRESLESYADFHLRDLLKDYGASLIEAQSILEEPRLKVHSTQEWLWAREAQITIPLWQNSLESFYDDLSKDHQNYQKALKDRLTEADQLVSLYQSLMNRSLEIEENLKKLLGSRIGLILEHYQNQRDQKLSKLKRRWADLEYVVYERIKEQGLSDIEELRAQSKARSRF